MPDDSPRITRPRCFLIYALAPAGMPAADANRLFNALIADERLPLPVFHDHFIGRPGGLAIFFAANAAERQVLAEIERRWLPGWQVDAHPLIFARSPAGFDDQIAFTLRAYRELDLETLRRAGPRGRDRRRGGDRERSGKPAMITTIGAYGLVGLFFVLEGWVRQGQAARSFKAGAHDRGSTRNIGTAFGVSILLLLLAPLLNFFRLGDVIPAPLAWAGLVLAAGGLGLRLWAPLVLGRFYTRTLLTGDLAAAVARLKAAPGGDIVVLGSGALVQSLRQARLVDEYVLLIHPLVLGTGRRLFAEGGGLTTLTLAESHTTPTGVVIATYHPAAQETAS